MNVALNGIDSTANKQVMEVLTSNICKHKFASACENANT